MTDRLSDNLQATNPFKAGDFSPEKHSELNLNKMHTEFEVHKPSLGKISQDMYGLTAKRKKVLNLNVKKNHTDIKQLRRLKTVSIYNKCTIINVLFHLIQDNMAKSAITMTRFNGGTYAYPNRGRPIHNHIDDDNYATTTTQQLRRDVARHTT